MMDAATISIKGTNYVLNNGLILTKNKIEKIKKRNRKSNQDSISTHGHFDVNYQIKCCCVLLQRLSDEEIRKYLSLTQKSVPIKTEKDTYIEPSEMPVEITKSVEHNLKTEVPDPPTTSPALLATEEHLDSLMANEMRLSYLQMERRYNNSTRPLKTVNLNPVVVLQRLSPHFISDIINGSKKTQGSQQETALIKRKRIPTTKRRKAVTGERRRSQRSSVVKSNCSCCSVSAVSSVVKGSRKLSSCSSRHSSCSWSGDSSLGHFSRRNYYNPRRHFSDKGRFSNEENIPRHKPKRRRRKLSNSDDEGEFYGFEIPERDRYKTLTMKKVLKKLPLHPSGKENEKFVLTKPDIKMFGRKKIPLKAVNRIESANGVPENISIFKEHRIHNELSMRGFDLNGNGKKNENEIYSNHILDDQGSGSSNLPVVKLEILKLFQEREETKNLINRLVIEQRKNIRSRKLGNNFLISDVDYRSNDFYIRRGGIKIPLWCDESVRAAIMMAQEEMPPEIADYFYTEQRLTLASLFSKNIPS